LWKRPDKVTRVSAISYYERGGIKMIDLECMIKSRRLAWLKRTFLDNNVAWKNLVQLTKDFNFVNT